MTTDIDGVKRVHTRLNLHTTGCARVECLTCEAAAALNYMIEERPGRTEARLVALIERKDREHAEQVADLTARLESRNQIIREVLERMDAFLAGCRDQVTDEATAVAVAGTEATS